MKPQNNVQVYIKAEGETFQFPVNPFSVSQDGGKKYETFDITYRGEIDFPSKKAKKIKTLTMDIMFPAEYEPYCNYEAIPKPSEIMKKIEKWSNLDKPIRLIITGYGFNELVHLADYPETETGDEQGDRRVDLGFRIVNSDNESTSTVEVKKKDSPSPKLKPRQQPEQKKIEVVKKGDSLWKLSKKIYGDGSQFNKIYAANKDIIGNDPGKIKPGQKLIIPA